MRRTPLWFVLIGGALLVIAVPVQAFSIAAYVQGAGEGALDMHGGFSLVVHIAQLLVVIGAIWAWWGNWSRVGGTVAFLVLAFAQLAFLAESGEGGWINGLHGFLALVILLAGMWYAWTARNALGLARTAAVER